ncbi:hypothetical protein BDW02DRAFT_600839 [Decorospora gaudefroyi]|uniref:Uncharacterized protein n=1 Tax=Decorospora gaudefroyi TaxID=184978 RepID=A0A6A5K3M1_9PLEO|nr:hypothetical protein BDW02DRAFT_600839 [Decorospora gaudefroyi]
MLGLGTKNRGFVGYWDATFDLVDGQPIFRNSVASVILENYLSADSMTEHVLPYLHQWGLLQDLPYQVVMAMAKRYREQRLELATLQEAEIINFITWLHQDQPHLQNWELLSCAVNLVLMRHRKECDRYLKVPYTIRTKVHHEVVQTLIVGDNGLLWKNAESEVAKGRFPLAPGVIMIYTTPLMPQADGDPAEHWTIDRPELLLGIYDLNEQGMRARRTLLKHEEKRCPGINTPFKRLALLCEKFDNIVGDLDGMDEEERAHVFEALRAHSVSCTPKLPHHPPVVHHQQTSKTDPKTCLQSSTAQTRNPLLTEDTSKSSKQTKRKKNRSKKRKAAKQAPPIAPNPNIPILDDRLLTMLRKVAYTGEKLDAARVRRDRAPPYGDDVRRAMADEAELTAIGEELTAAQAEFDALQEEILRVHLATHEAWRQTIRAQARGEGEWEDSDESHTLVGDQGVIERDENITSGAMDVLGPGVGPDVLEEGNVDSDGLDPQPAGEEALTPEENVLEERSADSELSHPERAVEEAPTPEGNVPEANTHEFVQVESSESSDDEVPDKKAAAGESSRSDGNALQETSADSESSCPELAVEEAPTLEGNVPEANTHEGVQVGSSGSGDDAVSGKKEAAGEASTPEANVPEANMYNVAESSEFGEDTVPQNKSAVPDNNEAVPDVKDASQKREEAKHEAYESDREGWQTVPTRKAQRKSKRRSKRKAAPNSAGSSKSAAAKPTNKVLDVARSKIDSSTTKRVSVQNAAPTWSDVLAERKPHGAHSQAVQKREAKNPWNVPFYDPRSKVRSDSFQAPRTPTSQAPAEKENRWPHLQSGIKSEDASSKSTFSLPEHATAATKYETVEDTSALAPAMKIDLDIGVKSPSMSQTRLNTITAPPDTPERLAPPVEPQNDSVRRVGAVAPILGAPKPSVGSEADLMADIEDKSVQIPPAGKGTDQTAEISGELRTVDGDRERCEDIEPPTKELAPQDNTSTVPALTLDIPNGPLDANTFSPLPPPEDDSPLGFPFPLSVYSSPPLEEETPQHIGANVSSPLPSYGDDLFSNIDMVEYKKWLHNHHAGVFLALGDMEKKMVPQPPQSAPPSIEDSSAKSSSEDGPEDKYASASIHPTGSEGQRVMRRTQSAPASTHVDASPLPSPVDTSPSQSPLVDTVDCRKWLQDKYTDAIGDLTDVEKESVLWRPENAAASPVAATESIVSYPPQENTRRSGRGGKRAAHKGFLNREVVVSERISYWW